MKYKLGSLLILVFIFYTLTVLAEDLNITCMEMIQGSPSQATTYIFHTKTGELTSDQYSYGPISTFKEMKLGHTPLVRGGSTSYSVHKWEKEGQILERTVRHAPDKGSKVEERSFHTFFDFKHQKVLDDEKIDSCRHSNTR